VPEEIDGIEVNLSKLPPDLQRLVPLIRRWATSDDDERSKRLAEASDDELREVSASPSELWDSINGYLDEYIPSVSLEELRRMAGKVRKSRPNSASA
jgi:hypothetical protein